MTSDQSGVHTLLSLQFLTPSHDLYIILLETLKGVTWTRVSSCILLIASFPNWVLEWIWREGNVLSHHSYAATHA